MVEHQDAVGADHARQPVRQDQGRAALRQPVERLLDHRLVLGIDRGQRLVEDQDRRIAQQCPGDRQALALAARQVDAALADDRAVALRQLPDEFVRVGVARRCFELVLGRVGLAEAQILLDRAVEQIGVLVHDGDLAAQRLGIERAQIMAADPDRPGLRIEQAQQQPRDRRFARAARADDADLLAGGDRERQPVMRRAAARRDRRNAHRRTRSSGASRDKLSERHGCQPACRQLPDLPAGDGFTSGSAASSAWMPAAADWPTMPWCSTPRRSRSGRNTSVPAISTIKSASIVISPCDTRHTPSASAAAAPIATPASVMPRVMTLVESTRIVVSDSCARALGEPAAIGGALAERLQGRQALHRVEEFRAEALHRLLARHGRVPPSILLKTAGATRVTSAATSITAATGTSHHTIKAKIASGVSAATADLRHVLAEKALQLLDAVDHRQHDAAGALAGEPGRPQFGDLVVELAAQLLLHPDRVLVRDDRAGMVEQPRAAAPPRRPRPPAARWPRRPRR